MGYNGAMASRRSVASRAPTLRVERELWADGHEFVVGVDEVGRGAWAGPISVGAAVIDSSRRVYGVRDSKQLSESQRERLFDRLTNWCVSWAVGHASERECDALGMSAAQRLAARRALDALSVRPDVAILDGRWNFLPPGLPVRAMVKADATCVSVATASILAKVTRDRLMRAHAESFPGYDFDSNKGYPAPAHVAALHGYGPTSLHRQTWAYLDHLSFGRRRPPFDQQTLFASPSELPTRTT